MIEFKEASELEDILFENEQAQAMVDCVQNLISEGVAEVKGVATDTINYTLYKAVEMMRSNNKRLLEVLSKKSE